MHEDLIEMLRKWEALWLCVYAGFVKTFITSVILYTKFQDTHASISARGPCRFHRDNIHITFGTQYYGLDLTAKSSRVSMNLKPLRCEEASDSFVYIAIGQKHSTYSRW